MISSLVVKLGGSLLSRPDLPGSLRHWLMAEDHHQQINLVIGGGILIDALRELDRIHRGDAVAMHWSCVGALRYTAELVAQWLPEATLIDTPERFADHRRQRRRGWFLIVPDSFYHRDSGDELPCDWTTTSDSIAALLANKLDCERLVVLKSCEVEPRLDLATAAATGIVDPVFPSLVHAGLSVELLPLGSATA